MRLITIILASVFTLSTEAAAVSWQNKICIGKSPTVIYADLNLKPSLQLFLGSHTPQGLQTNILQIKGNVNGNNGSKVFISLNSNGRSGFLDILGAANGAIEIVPDFPADWNGAPIEFAKAKKENSFFNVFTMQNIENEDFSVQIKYEIRNENIVWYLEKVAKNSCLPLIVQLGNHTLLANNNSATNGGHKFVYYIWRKNGISLKEGTHADNCGSYFTGNEDLATNAEYTVEAVDGKGTHYFSCPFVPKNMSLNVKVYPNPLPKNAAVNIDVETENVGILNDAVVEIYEATGKYIEKKYFRGQSKISFDLPSKSGLYLLNFKSQDFVKTFKITVK